MTRPAPLSIWTITLDSQHFAVRRFWVDLGTVRLATICACLCDSLDEARAVIPPGLRRLTGSDDPGVLETWIGLPTA